MLRFLFREVAFDPRLPCGIEHTLVAVGCVGRADIREAIEVRPRRLVEAQWRLPGGESRYGPG